MLALLLSAVIAGVPESAEVSTEKLDPERAVALALERNRDLISARLEVESAEIDTLAASLPPNPALSYPLANVVLPPANPQGIGLRPGPFDQTVHTLAISQALDVWFKRSLRRAGAEKGVEQARLE